MIRNATVDSDIRLRRLRRAAALWLGGGLLLLTLGPWPPWSPTYGWSLVYALLLAPLAVLAWLLTLAPAGTAAWAADRTLQDRDRPGRRDDATTAISRRCRDGGVRGGAGSPA